MNTKQSDKTHAHIEKKQKHLKVSQPGCRNSKRNNSNKKIFQKNSATVFRNTTVQLRQELQTLKTKYIYAYTKD